MLVYRFEDQEYIGPYTGELPDLSSGLGVSQWYPDDDGMPTLGQEYLYGFVDMNQLFQWFNEDHLATLEVWLFDLVMIEVPDEDVVLGGHQLAFRDGPDVHRNVLDWQHVWSAVESRKEGAA